MSLYYCAASGEIEDPDRGGFDTCCSAPQVHIPVETLVHNHYVLVQFEELLANRVQTAGGELRRRAELDQGVLWALHQEAEMNGYHALPEEEEAP